MYMQSKQNLILICVSITAGIILGAIGGPVFILIPWAVVGLVIGIFSTRKKLAVISGALYGFAVAYTFMLSGYDGADPIETRIIPFVPLVLVGAVCGLILGLIGYFVRYIHLRKRL